MNQKRNIPPPVPSWVRPKLKKCNRVSYKLIAWVKLADVYDIQLAKNLRERNHRSKELSVQRRHTSQIPKYCMVA